MTEITTELSKLLVHATFFDLCTLPTNSDLIDQLEARLIEKDAQFFKNNDAFYAQEDYDPENAAHRTDFERTVQLLRDVYNHGLLVDADGAVDAVLNHYGVPRLEKEKRRGALIATVIEAIESSVTFRAEIIPKAAVDRRDCPEVLAEKADRDQFCRSLQIRAAFQRLADSQTNEAATGPTRRHEDAPNGVADLRRKHDDIFE